MPYLDRCVLHATILNSRAEAYADMLEGDRIAEMALHNPQLVKGIAASLRTLIIASFRAPATQFVMSLLRRLNPTAQILRAAAFCRHHEYIFALLCLLNVNMGALDLSRGGDGDGTDPDADSYNAHALLHELASVYSAMDVAAQGRVYKRVMSSGALPISRDTPSYVAVMSVLHGGAADSQLDYVIGKGNKEEEDEENYMDTRAEAKSAHATRMALLAREGTDSKDLGVAAGAENANGGNGNSSGSSSDAKADAKRTVVGDHTPPRRSDKAASRDKQPSEATIRGEFKAAERDASYRLLGDLPGLGRDRAQQAEDVKVALSLELPAEGARGKPGQTNAASTAQPKARSVDDGIPSEYKCAINGHVMKEPLRCVTSGLCFEKATIELWLATRGSVCPITNTHMERGDLEPADDLRNRIKRFHIQQTSMRTAAKQEDDLYDF